MVLLASKAWPRSRSASAKARLARAWARLARICSSAISNGRRSMVKSRSPFFTIWPSCEMNFGQIAGQPGADLDRIHRDEAADIFVVIDDRALHRIGDGDGRRRRRRALLLALAAAGQRHEQRRRRQHSTARTRRIAEFMILPSKRLGIIGGRISVNRTGAAHRPPRGSPPFPWPAPAPHICAQSRQSPTGRNAGLTC